MPNCLDKKRNEIIAPDEYYPIFEGYGIRSNKATDIVKLSRIDRCGSRNVSYLFPNDDFINYSWWEVVYLDGKNGTMPVVHIANIERIED